MITRYEIESKAVEFDINCVNVERDYVFGWVLCGIYTASLLKDILILKGGNALRKAYFATTRYSNDLDFSTQDSVSEQLLLQEFDKICDFVQEMSGVVFEKDRNKYEEKKTVDKEVKSYQVKLFFKDFYGKPGSVVISVKLDIKEFDRIFLPVQSRSLIHPYSDSKKCDAQISCLKLEEMLAAKLKCLLQRRHSFDLYDYVYAIFINNEIEVNKAEIVSTFFRKTIFERSPGVVTNLLLGLPVQIFKAAWEKYIVCPKDSLVPFESALESFFSSIRSLFGEGAHPRLASLFYPAHMRNMILEAGSGMKLMSITYDNSKRVVEPYSLVYKRRKDGHAEEYLYVWDRSGGNSGPGIKTFINTKIQDVSILEEKFEPQYTVELSKAGEPASSGYFGRSNFGNRTGHRVGGNTKTHAGSGITYTVQCAYCGKRFKRTKYSTRVRKHQDSHGNQCYGRYGTIVS